MRKFAILILSALIPSVLLTANLPAKQRGIRVIAKSGESIYLYKDYHALVVGVSDYEKWPDLPNAVKDAREVASELRAIGFKVELLLDPTSGQLNSALSAMAFQIGNERERAVLFYFAGHGETTKLADGTELGYIIPRDCPLQSQDPMGFDDKAISMKEIGDVALKIKSKHVLMLFDSCFSGSLFSMVRSAPVDISEKSARPVRQFITAGTAEEEVPDRSVFKTVFLHGIKGYADLNDDGFITGSELGMHLQEKVINYSRGAQHPQYGKINNPKLDRGDFIFALKATSRPPTSISTAQPTPGGSKDYESIIQKRRTTKKNWDRWQASMEANFAKAQAYDRSSYLTSEEKEDAWATFLASYEPDNPYSTKDDELKKKAQERRKRWKEHNSGPAGTQGHDYTAHLLVRAKNVGEHYSDPYGSYYDRRRGGYRAGTKDFGSGVYPAEQTCLINGRKLTMNANKIFYDGAITPGIAEVEASFTAGRWDGKKRRQTLGEKYSGKAQFRIDKNDDITIEVTYICKLGEKDIIIKAYKNE